MKPRHFSARGQSTSELAVVLGLAFLVAAGAVEMLNPAMRGIFQRTTECVISDVCKDGHDVVSLPPIGGGAPFPPSGTNPVVDGGPPSECDQLRARLRQLASTQRNQADAIGRMQALIDASDKDRSKVFKKYAKDQIINRADDILHEFRTIREIVTLTGSPKLAKILLTLGDTQKYYDSLEAGNAFGKDMNATQTQDLATRMHADAVRINDLLVNSGIADEVGGDLAKLLGPAGVLAYRTATAAIDAGYAFGQAYIDAGSAKLAKEQIPAMQAGYDRVARTIQELETELATKCDSVDSDPVIDGGNGAGGGCVEATPAKTPAPTSSYDVSVPDSTVKGVQGSELTRFDFDLYLASKEESFKLLAVCSGCGSEHAILRDKYESAKKTHFAWQTTEVNVFLAKEEVVFTVAMSVVHQATLEKIIAGASTQLGAAAFTVFNAELKNCMHTFDEKQENCLRKWLEGAKELVAALKGRGVDAVLAEDMNFSVAEKFRLHELLSKLFAAFDVAIDAANPFGRALEASGDVRLARGNFDSAFKQYEVAYLKYRSCMNSKCCK